MSIFTWSRRFLFAIRAAVVQAPFLLTVFYIEMCAAQTPNSTTTAITTTTTMTTTTTTRPRLIPGLDWEDWVVYIVGAGIVVALAFIITISCYFGECCCFSKHRRSRLANAVSGAKYTLCLFFSGSSEKKKKIVCACRPHTRIPKYWN